MEIQRSYLRTKERKSMDGKRIEVVMVDIYLDRFGKEFEIPKMWADYANMERFLENEEKEKLLGRNCGHKI